MSKSGGIDENSAHVVGVSVGSEHDPSRNAIPEQIASRPGPDCGGYDMGSYEYPNRGGDVGAGHDRERSITC